MAALLHGDAVLHDQHIVGQARDHAEIVADEDHTQVAPFAQSVDEEQDLLLHGDIERGGGLVRDQQARFGNQRHGDHHALAHAA